MEKDIKDLSDGLNDVLLYVNGTIAPGTISIIMDKNYAIKHAEALLDAAQSLGGGQPNVAFVLEGHMIPKKKAMLTNIDYSEKGEEATGESEDTKRTIQ